MCPEYITHFKRVNYRFNPESQDLITLIYCIYPTSLIFSRLIPINQLEKWDHHQYDNRILDRTTLQMTYLSCFELRFEGTHVLEYFEFSNRAMQYEMLFTELQLHHRAFGRPRAGAKSPFTKSAEKRPARSPTPVNQISDLSLGVCLAFPGLLFFEFLL